MIIFKGIAMNKAPNNYTLIALSLITIIGLNTSLLAGKITTQLQGTPSNVDGFNGWNLNNVDVLITDTNYQNNGKNYDQNTGSYDDTYGDGDSFESIIYSDDTKATIMGRLHGKDWPVGEPDGIKVLHDITGTTNGRPANCIINTSYVDLPEDDADGFLDASNPTPINCAHPFQTHKRFKINFQPATIADGIGQEKGVDLLFNVEAEAGARSYEVFQKINNYTGKRLQGYTIELGFGLGDSFIPATTTEDIKLSIGLGEDDGADIWAANEMATFSHGLWGAPDSHFSSNGFFDGVSSGYNVSLDVNQQHLTSISTLGSNYETLFGPWLTREWAPEGIFFDHDNDPSTDAELMAFWSDFDGTNHTGIFEWRAGKVANFNVVEQATLYEWATNPLYAVDVVEDTLNLGLNYMIVVGDVTTYPSNTFTLRITPILADDATQNEPGWITNSPTLSYQEHKGIMFVSPTPTFLPGSALTVRVADVDLNLDANAIDTFTLVVTNDQGETEHLLLSESDNNTSIFEGTLLSKDTTEQGIDNDNILYVSDGTLVTVTYNDANADGAGTAAVVILSVTAADEAVAVILSDNNTAKGIFSTMDTFSLLAMIFGFLLIGGLIARKRVA